MRETTPGPPWRVEKVSSIAPPDKRHLVGLAGWALLAGAFSGTLAQVGGGTVIVPMLIALYHYGDRLATGTSLAAIIVIAVPGGQRCSGISATSISRPA